ncbi:enoyl-CoA hydratase, partial [Sinorhizobium meliloti]|uniref:enoyl-CoA hydratase-related protein n=1 Tax=Rhizobium meliloti TaxID=382 RepID=UPI000FDB066F
MTFDTIRCAIDQRGVARVTLARSEKHNALSATMIGELTAVVGRLATDASIRAVILDAEGKSFCAGGDLDWMRQQFSADRPTRIAEATRLAMMLKALNDLPKPLIARVHGNAFGGGVGLISVCDTVIAASGAQFGLTETRLGLIPATISPYVIARTGEARARPLFMSARVFGAEEAKVAGFVTTVAAGPIPARGVAAAGPASLLTAPGLPGPATPLGAVPGLPPT